VDASRGVLVLVNAFTWVGTRHLCSEVRKLGCECFDYHAVTTAISQSEQHVPDVDQEAMLQLREFVRKSTAKVIVVVGVSRERIEPQYSFWIKIPTKDLEAHYRLAMENQLDVILNNAGRIQNAINNYPIGDVGRALTQYGFDVDMSTSFKSFVSAYRAVTFFGYNEGQILSAEDILRVIGKLCAA
jgi:hypothetical protein